GPERTSYELSITLANFCGLQSRDDCTPRRRVLLNARGMPLITNAAHRCLVEVLPRPNTGEDCGRYNVEFSNRPASADPMVKSCLKVQKAKRPTAGLVMVLQED